MTRSATLCTALHPRAGPVCATPRSHAAHELWIRECADYHGLAGAADGRLAVALDRRPHSFADACHPISDEWIARVILEGGGSFGGDQAMREHHGLAERPEVLAAPPETAQTVADQREVCMGAGARGARSFFIDGDLLVGSQKIEAFTEIVDDELRSHASGSGLG